MANLQVRDIDDELYMAIKKRAGRDHRSISQEVVQMIETCLAMPSSKNTNATNEFLELTGSWGDDGDAKSIVKMIRKGRGKSSRFGKSTDVFD